MKIMIIGYSGSGKSTLAQVIGEHYNIPVLHLDRVNFKENWVERETSEALLIVNNFIELNQWVIDGNYRRFNQEKRLEDANLIIFMTFNRFSCLWRVFKRYLNYKNKSRDSAADGCIEKLDFEFVMWILKNGRTKSVIQHYKSVTRTYQDKVLIVRNQNDLNRLIQRIEIGEILSL